MWAVGPWERPHLGPAGIDGAGSLGTESTRGCCMNHEQLGTSRHRGRRDQIEPRLACDTGQWSDPYYYYHCREEICSRRSLLKGIQSSESA